MEINIYVADLAAYNDGELVGKWVSLPVDEEKLNEVINELTHDGQHDYAIHDWEAPTGVQIGEYSNPWELNELAERIQALNSYEQDDLEYIVQAVDGGIEEALDVLENGEYRIYHDCWNMKDVAEVVMDETGMLSEIPEHLQYFFDFEGYGRLLETSGNFTYCGSGVYVELFR